MKRTSIALGLLCLSAPLWAGAKESQYQQMIQIAEQMRDLKAAGQAGGAAYGALRAQYLELSSAMGGDDPGSLVGGAAPAVDGRGGAGATQGGGIGTVPATPAGCAATATVFTQSTPVAIVDVGTVTSSVVVSGVGTYLFDVNLQTVITHTFAADMDITIQSPAGTVVTLSTDNGAGNDNVFNGTVWDDDANPGGQVPYTTNDGLATDHAYVNLTTATPLVPEEAFGAFIGEDPNGTWTITVSDDLAGDTGSIDSWSIQVATFATAPQTANTSATQSTPVAIVDVGTVTSSVVVSGAGTSILDVNLTTFITHTFAADMDITIQSPAGTVVTLSTDNGAGNDNVFNGTAWDDDANPGGQVPYTTNNGLATDHAYVDLTTATPLVPEEALAAFIGEDPNGTWTITVSDDLAGDTGSIDSWSIDVTTFTCGCTLNLTCPADVSEQAAPGDTGANVLFPAPVVGGSCSSVTTICAPASGSFFPIGTTGVNCSATDGPTGTSASCGFAVTVVAGQSVLEIPTASGWGLAALATALLAAATFLLRRRA